MTFDFYTDLTNFAIGVGFGKSHKCSGYLFNLSIEFMFFMVLLRFGKVKELTDEEWQKD